ncbi:MAG: BlaI/MecI/CopY family transcriptional regulator [Verrucomicrobiota bacterium]
MKPSPAELNPVELKVLGILWEKAPMKPSEIEAAFSSEIENATLRSILRGLVEKGFLKRERQGKAYFYQPARQASAVRRKITDRLASVFADGSRLGLIAQLIQDEKLTESQLEELRKLTRKD